jgi:hypothetical protein
MPNGDTIVKIVRPFAPAAKDVPAPAAPATDKPTPKSRRVIKKPAAPEPEEFELEL